MGNILKGLKELLASGGDIISVLTSQDASLTDPLSIFSDSPNDSFSDDNILKDEIQTFGSKFFIFLPYHRWGTLGIFDTKKEASNLVQKAKSIGYNQISLPYKNPIRVVHKFDIDTNINKFYVMSLLFGQDDDLLADVDDTKLSKIINLSRDFKFSQNILIQQKSNGTTQIKMKQRDSLPFPSFEGAKSGWNVEEYIEYWEARHQKGLRFDQIKDVHYGCVGISMLHLDGPPLKRNTYLEFSKALKEQENLNKSNKNPNHRYVIYSILFYANDSDRQKYKSSLDANTGRIDISSWSMDTHNRYTKLTQS